MHNRFVPIKDFEDYLINNEGKIWSTKTNKFVGKSDNGQGYLRVDLWNGKHNYRRINRLVLEMFTGPCPQGKEACHNNGIRNDNRLENLRWDTRSNNQLDKVKHGNCPFKKGNDSFHNKLLDTDISHIKDLCLAYGMSQSECSRIYSVTSSTIREILIGDTWKHIDT